MHPILSIAYLDCSSCNVAIMGQTSSKRWTVVESELRLALRELKLLMEGIDFLPKLEYLFFFLREVRFVGY